jgi:arsenate reductase
VLKVYLYKNCSTCRDAKKWLEEKGIEFEEKAIRETPPTVEELARASEEPGMTLQRLFNSSGGDYREMGLKDKLPSMSRDEIFALLASRGNLVKRPFVIGKNIAITGFKVAEWEKILGDR